MPTTNQWSARKDAREKERFDDLFSHKGEREL